MPADAVAAAGHHCQGRTAHRLIPPSMITLDPVMKAASSHHQDGDCGHENWFFPARRAASGDLHPARVDIHWLCSAAERRSASMTADCARASSRPNRDRPIPRIAREKLSICAR